MQPPLGLQNPQGLQAQQAQQAQQTQQVQQAQVTLDTTYEAAPPELRAQVDEVRASSAEFTALHASTNSLISENVLAFDRFAARVQSARARLQRLRGAQGLAEVGLAQLAAGHSEGKSLAFTLRSDEAARAELVESYWANTLRSLRVRATELLSTLDSVMTFLTGRGLQGADSRPFANRLSASRLSASTVDSRTQRRDPDLLRAERAIFRANSYSRLSDLYGALEAQAFIIDDLSERLARAKRPERPE